MIELWAEPALRAVVEALEDCVIGVDVDERIAVVHCGDERLLPHVPAAELVGKRLDAAFPMEVARALRLAMQALGRTSVPQTVTYSIETGQGERRFEARLGRLTWEAEARGTLIVVRDVTSQALTHQTMLESEAFYRLLAENSSDVISVQDLEGKYLYISPSVARVGGYATEEVVGRYRHEFMHPDDLSQMRERWPEMMPGPDGARLRFRIRHRQGHWQWIEILVKRIEWQGKPALLSSARDISHTQEAEERAASMLRELEEARRKAETANRAKSVFLTSISHDLRTPLHGILGMSELLDQTHLTPEQGEYVAAIRESGDALLARLNDLLDLSKIESGKLDLQAADFDLVEAVEGLTDILGSQAKEHGIELFCHVGPDVPAVVRGDPTRLRQVLLNLIGNSIRCTRRGEVDVRVGRGEAGAIRFTVRDTGAGMTPEQVKAILEREPLADRGRHLRTRGGPGLGLTIAGQLIELMGGALGVESREGQGSTFSFELPLPASDRPLARVESSPLTGRRILAADDNATNRQLVREILEQAGAEVELSSGGVETIRNLLDDPAYDCVILSANLPDLDGLATAAMIRANRTLERLPIVLLISSAEPHEVERSRQLEVNAVLTKPVRRDVLLRAVSEVVTAGTIAVAGQPAAGTILVVEDNEVSLRVARDILRRAGYGVVSARDGEEAIKQLESHRVDAVLMDIQLPDMDGMEATARIRETPAWARIPIIAMTAHAMKGDAERFLRAGADDCLSKPVNQVELLTCLERELGKRRSPTAHGSSD